MNEREKLKKILSLLDDIYMLANKLISNTENNFSLVRKHMRRNNIKSKFESVIDEDRFYYSLTDYSIKILSQLDEYYKYYTDHIQLKDLKCDFFKDLLMGDCFDVQGIESFKELKKRLELDISTYDKKYILDKFIQQV